MSFIIFTSCILKVYSIAPVCLYLFVSCVDCNVSQMFRSMMEAQDQLERKYISNKEEHRALEMQNYIGLRRNTGTFDPDRSEVIAEL